MSAPRPRLVALPFTEDAVRTIRLTHADFSRLNRNSPSVSGIGRLRENSRHDPFQVRAQSELSRIVTIVEGHVATAITFLFDIYASGAGPFVQTISSAILEQSETTWETRRGALEKYFGISLVTCRGYQGLERAILARNVIAHGAGSLTRRQQNPKDRDKLRALGARLVGNSMILTEAALKNCLVSAIEVIEDLDKLLPRS